MCSCATGASAERTNLPRTGSFDLVVVIHVVDVEVGHGLSSFGDHNDAAAPGEMGPLIGDDEPVTTRC